MWDQRVEAAYALLDSVVAGISPVVLRGGDGTDPQLVAEIRGLCEQVIERTRVIDRNASGRRMCHVTCPLTHTHTQPRARTHTQTHIPHTFLTHIQVIEMLLGVDMSRDPGLVTPVRQGFIALIPYMRIHGEQSARVLERLLSLLQVFPLPQNAAELSGSSDVASLRRRVAGACMIYQTKLN